MADEPNRYPIGTIQQMASIPQEARPRFLAELPDILASVEAAMKFYALLNEAMGEEVAKLGTPDWIDDDKGTATYRGLDSETGEEIISATVKMRRPA